MTVYIIKKNKRNYKKKLSKLTKQLYGFDAKKYCGKIEIKKDPVKYQKDLRNEWE